MKKILALALLAPLAVSACATGSGRPFAFGKKGELVDFSYSWPAEATAIRPLARRFQRELDASFKTTLAAATADRNSAAKDGRPFRGHQFAFDWNTAGQSRRLLSLQAALSSFTGGAHGNRGSKALLWDRRAGRDLALDSLFTTSARFDALTRTDYCRALDQQRARKRGGNNIGAFTDCPTVTQRTNLIADRDRNGRFDTLRMIADPYVAGPYVEGDYVVDLPITATTLAAIKPAWRADFEVAR